MNIDLTRHGGYQLDFSLAFDAIMLGVFVVGLVIWAAVSFLHRGDGTPMSFKERAGLALSGLLGVPMILVIPFCILSFCMGVFPVGQGIGNIKSSPFSTNYLQTSKKLPENHISYIEAKKISSEVESVDSSHRGSEYAQRIWNSVGQHYSMKLISMKINDVNYTDFPMAVLAMNEDSNKVQNCQLNVSNINKISHDHSEYVKSFDGYLTCNGSEAPTRR